MIDRIKNAPALKPHIKEQCSDEDISTTFAADINPAHRIVIKVDEYYKSLKIKAPPPSIDCLIILKCSDGVFSIFLVELKNQERAKNVDKPKAVKKFETTINDFMSHRFQDIFCTEQVAIKKPRFLVVAAYAKRRKSSIGKEFSMTQKPIHYRGFNITIKIAEPGFKIENC